MTESTKTHVILLSCGSFNPITKGHIHMFGKEVGDGVVSGLGVFGVFGDKDHRNPGAEYPR